MSDQSVLARTATAAAAIARASAAVRLVGVGTSAVVLAVILIAMPAASAQAAVSGQPGSGPTAGPAIGPALISPLRHPGLCWQAEGNGSPITLEHCDSAVQGQQWTFTGNNVVMNGNGYCLQNGGAARGRQAGARLFLSFSGQCAGAAGQQWTFGGGTNLIENPPSGLCAYPQGGLVPGAPIAGRRCAGHPAADTWSFGFSDLTLSGGAHRTSAAGSTAAGPTSTGSTGAATAEAAGTASKRAFAAEVAVSNPARAMTAFGASVSIMPPGGLTVTRLTGTGGLSGWACALKTLSCHGNLPAGGNGQISVTGTVARRAPASQVAATAMIARATVTGTNQSGRPVRRTAVSVRVFALTSAGQTGTGQTSTGLPGAARGTPASSVATFGLVAAVLLVMTGTVLAVVTRRRRAPGPGATLAAPGPRE